MTNGQNVSGYENEQPLTKKRKGLPGPGDALLRLVVHYRIDITPGIKKFPWMETFRYRSRNAGRAGMHPRPDWEYSAYASNGYAGKDPADPKKMQAGMPQPNG